MIQFNLDFQKWVTYLTPSVLRQSRMMALAQAFVKPIQTAHALFLSYRIFQNELAKTTGQVAILRGYLNRRFVGSSGILIDIVDDELLAPTFVYLQSENRPLYLPTYVAQTGGSDFVVKVPGLLMSQERQIIAAVNLFRLPSKVFRIEYY